MNSQYINMNNVQITNNHQSFLFIGILNINGTIYTYK